MSCPFLEARSPGTHVPLSAAGAKSFSEPTDAWKKERRVRGQRDLQRWGEPGPHPLPPAPRKQVWAGSAHTRAAQPGRTHPSVPTAPMEEGDHAQAQLQVLGHRSLSCDQRTQDAPLSRDAGAQQGPAGWGTRNPRAPLGLALEVAGWGQQRWDAPAPQPQAAGHHLPRPRHAASQVWGPRPPLMH